MPADIRFPPGCAHGGSIRLGPKFFKWGDPLYEHSLPFEMAGNIAVIGGLDWPISPEENRWVIDAFCRRGLYPAMERLQKDGTFRASLLPIPREFTVLRRNRPASLEGLLTPQGAFMRKPLPISHADTSTPAGRAATALETHHAGVLIAEGLLDIKGKTEGEPDADGWQDVHFKRKLHPSLTA